MSYELKAAPAREAMLCRYGESKLLVRGPERDLDTPYLAFIGSTETYGRFIENPFPAEVEHLTGHRCVNFGAVNGGLDSYYYDDDLRRIARDSDGVALQVMGAQNISNDYYGVHPRRNDRFLRVQPRLKDLYPEVDFTEFHFNKHMLTVLQEMSPERFRDIEVHLKETWVARMGELIADFSGPVLLIWLRYDLGFGSRYSQEPVMVDEDMINALKPKVDALISIEVATAGEADDMAGMSPGQLELPTARLMLGPKEHHRIAKAIADRLE